MSRLIFYDWGKISNLPNKELKKVIQYLCYRKAAVPSIKTLNIVSNFTNPTGFLINAEELLYYWDSISDIEIKIYLEIAALRSYYDYKLKGITYVKRDYIELFYSIESLYSYKTIIVTDTNVKLKYEEN